jgi:hypothetical protein
MEYLSQKELALRWKCSSAAIGQYRKKKLITAMRLPQSKRWIYPLKAVLDYEGYHTQEKQEEWSI